MKPDSHYGNDQYTFSRFTRDNLRNLTLAVVDSIKERCLQWIDRDCWRMRLKDNMNPIRISLGLVFRIRVSV